MATECCELLTTFKLVSISTERQVHYNTASASCSTATTKIFHAVESVIFIYIASWTTAQINVPYCFPLHHACPTEGVQTSTRRLERNHNRHGNVIISIGALGIKVRNITPYNERLMCNIEIYMQPLVIE